MFRLTCKNCGKIIDGYTAKQVEYLFMQHNLSKHKEALIAKLKKLEELEKLEDVGKLELEKVKLN